MPTQICCWYRWSCRMQISAAETHYTQTEEGSLLPLFPSQVLDWNQRRFFFGLFHPTQLSYSLPLSWFLHRHTRLALLVSFLHLSCGHNTLPQSPPQVPANNFGPALGWRMETHGLTDKELRVDRRLWEQISNASHAQWHPLKCDRVWKVSKLAADITKCFPHFFFFFKGKIAPLDHKYPQIWMFWRLIF